MNFIEKKHEILPFFNYPMSTALVVHTHRVSNEFKTLMSPRAGCFVWMFDLDHVVTTHVPYLSVNKNYKYSVKRREWERGVITSNENFLRRVYIVIPTQRRV